MAPRNLKPAEAAQLIGIDEAALRNANNIPPRMLVKAGSTLLVPRAAHITADVSEHVADHAALSLVAETRPQRRLQLKAGRQGETVAAVAQRYRTSAAQVAQWNGVSAQGRFKPGQTIVVMVAGSAPTTARTSIKPGSVKNPMPQAAETTRMASKVSGTRKAAGVKPATRLVAKKTKPTATARTTKPGAAATTAAASAGPARLAQSGVQAAPR